MQLLFLMFIQRYCPARWIWRKVGLFGSSSSLKSEARSFSEKSVQPPSYEGPLKIQRHLVQLLAIITLIPKRGHEIHRAVGREKTWCFCTGINIATGINAQVQTPRSVHCTVANIAECIYRRCLQKITTF